MKLIFPNGEHAAVGLTDGITLIGSGSDCHVVLAAPGVAVNHCEIEMHDGKAIVRIQDRIVATVLNGRQITEESHLKAGDLLLFGRIGCRIVASEKTIPPVDPRPVPADDFDGQTRIRRALPKFMLRGVSGATFGRNFAIVGTMTIGRQSDCGIPIQAEEISRQHARLQVTAEGVMVEDLGSANGTWINDKRVHTGMLSPGDELRLDTVRFLLVAPGVQVPSTPAAPVEPVQVPARKASNSALWIIAGIVAVGLVAIGVLRFLGKI